MKMCSAKGDAISSASNAVNMEGDNANSKMDMATGSLSGYSATLTATNTGATASLDTSAKCAIGANITFRSTAYNKEGDHTESYAELYGGLAPYLGSINGYSSDANAMHSQASIKQSETTATGNQVWFSISAYNNEGDKSTTSTQITKGQLSGYSDLATAQIGNFVSSKVGITSAYGSLAKITSQAKNLAEYEDHQGVHHNGGEADFVVSKTNNVKLPKSTVYTTATANDLNVFTSGMSKTALILEPFKCDNFGNSFGSTGSAGSALEGKGYAVTYYRDAGVSWDKVHKLDEYTVSLISTHGVVDDTTKDYPNTIGLSISKCGDHYQETWQTLQPYLTTKNDLIIIDACDPFNTNSYQTEFKGGKKTYTPGMYAVSKAKVSGGFIGSVVYSYPNNDFINTFFTRLAQGDTAEAANTAASSSVGNKQVMTLQGSYKTFKLK
jgi:hypothetical protein